MAVHRQLADQSTTDAVGQVFQACNVSTRPVAEMLLALLLQEHPNANVLAWPKQSIVSFGIGPKKMSQHYAYIGINSAHVNLGFYMGTSLDDASSILEGTGKNLRHIKLRTTEEAAAPAVIALIREALQERLTHAPSAA